MYFAIIYVLWLLLLTIINNPLMMSLYTMNISVYKVITLGGFSQNGISRLKDINSLYSSTHTAKLLLKEWY